MHTNVRDSRSRRRSRRPTMREDGADGGGAEACRGGVSCGVDVADHPCGLRKN